MSWMIYGANGYTGELIARQAVALGMKPVLAGRSADKIQALANALGLPHRVFDLNRPRREWQGQLQGMQLVLRDRCVRAPALAPQRSPGG